MPPPQVDGQSGIGPFGWRNGGGPSVVRRHVREMEASVSRHFEGNRCINCMCHSTENLYEYSSTSLIRAADDFYPRDGASQPVHLANVAYNSLWLGQVRRGRHVATARPPRTANMHVHTQGHGH